MSEPLVNSLPSLPRGFRAVVVGASGGTVRRSVVADSEPRHHLFKNTYRDDFNGFQDQKTLAVGERVAALKHTNAVARAAANEERRTREAKTERLRKLRLPSKGKA
jgi:hypothetical protein